LITRAFVCLRQADPLHVFELLFVAEDPVSLRTLISHVFYCRTLIISHHDPSCTTDRPGSNR